MENRLNLMLKLPILLLLFFQNPVANSQLQNVVNTFVLRFAMPVCHEVSLMNAHPCTKSMDKSKEEEENIGMKNVECLLYKQQP